MALYEGIALIQEKQAVVLDLGTDYTKFGFTGEAAPRCIVRSEFWCATSRRFQRLHDYDTPEELYDNLVHMLHLLYFRHVLVNPKERKVVVVESLLTPTLFRETLAKVLFTHYEVSGVIWADSPRLCALTLGTTAALVVSIGAREAEVAAVVHGCIVLRALQAQPLGAGAVHAELARLLDLGRPAPLHLPEHVIEDIKVKTCFVTSRARALQWSSETPPTPARDVQYACGTGTARGTEPGGTGTARGTEPGGTGTARGTEPGGTGTARGTEPGGTGTARGTAPGGTGTARGTITVSGAARELAAEPLFARDNELASLPDAVLQCIALCPIDARRALAANVVLAGGGAALPGLRARLRDELRHLVAEPPYSSRLHIEEFKFHSPPAHENSVAWLGGAVLGAGEACAARALPREVYAREPRLRDWVCLLDNTPPAHPHRDHLDI